MAERFQILMMNPCVELSAQCTGDGLIQVQQGVNHLGLVEKPSEGLRKKRRPSRTAR